MTKLLYSMRSPLLVKAELLDPLSVADRLSASRFFSGLPSWSWSAWWKAFLRYDSHVYCAPIHSFFLAFLGLGCRAPCML